MSYIMRLFHAIKEAALADVDESYNMNEHEEETGKNAAELSGKKIITIDTQLNDINERITKLNESYDELSARVDKLKELFNNGLLKKE